MPVRQYKMHIGIIPDGNRRYMKKNGIRNLRESYRMGISRFYDLISWCSELGVDEVTIYALSIENLKNRGKLEIVALLNLFTEQAVSALNDDRIHKNKIQVNICGDREYLINKTNSVGLGGKIITSLDKLENSTKEYDGIRMNLAIAYGGRQEIVNAVRETIDAGLEVTEETIKDRLWVKSYPEIIIRTSEVRISNFLLWQSAYSEIYFVDKLWQEFERDDLVEILDNYGAKERRFGK